MPAPLGVRFTDGFPTTFSFGYLPSGVHMWEISVKPPGFDQGGPIDTTTMRNVQLRTHAPKQLATMTPMTGTFAYNELVLDDILAMRGKNQIITITYPNGSTWAFWGYLDKFEPNEIREGDQPTAGYTIQPTNQNNSGVETLPTKTPATTTTSSTTTTTT